MTGGELFSFFCWTYIRTHFISTVTGSHLVAMRGTSLGMKPAQRMAEQKEKIPVP
jgi:hypothetical protein